MTKFLIFLVLIFAVILVAQLVRIYELVTVLRGGAKDDEVSLSDNRFNANLLIAFLVAFMVFFVWQIVAWKQFMLPAPSSEHGVDIDNLFDFNMIILIVVFTITNVLLFYFSFKYYFRKEKKAYYFTHSNKLEFIWTIIPAVVLAVIIIYGLMTWNKITDTPPEDALVIEIYGKQFDWTARYTGADGQLGAANYRLIEGANDLGLDATDPATADDIVVKGEFHIPVGRPVNFIFRSRDIIHSAYMPHFRAQMNVVPGMTTQFHFLPTKTTAQMKDELKNPEFEYVLLCNKICGAAHYNMQITLVVDTEEEYQKWISSQKAYGQQAPAAASQEAQGQEQEKTLTAEN